MTTRADTAAISDPSADDVALTALADLQFLCEQRSAALQSPEFGEDILTAFDERIAAQLDALLSRGPHIVPWLVAQLASAAEPSEVCGLALALLHSGNAQALEAVLTALDAAKDEPKLRGLNLALQRGPIEPLVPRLREWLKTGSAGQAARATAVLASHSHRIQNAEQVAKLCLDSDPAVRQAAWRAVALLD